MTYQPRDRASFQHALLAMLPEGPVWPRALDSTLARTLLALAEPVARWAEDCAVYLVREAFPPTSELLLSDWERVLGLPEPCIPVPQTMPERQAAVLEKLQRRPGGASKAYFIEIAHKLGYHEYGPSPYALGAELEAPLGRLIETTITEFRPFACGISRCGDSRWSIAPPRMRFVWRVNVPGRHQTWFRTGHQGGRTGHDPHLRIRRAEDLECIFRQFTPAHTHLIFSYNGA